MFCVYCEKQKVRANRVRVTVQCGTPRSAVAGLNSDTIWCINAFSVADAALCSVTHGHLILFLTLGSYSADTQTYHERCLLYTGLGRDETKSLRRVLEPSAST